METKQLEGVKETETFEAINTIESAKERALKRKRVVLTLEDKLDVIKEREKGYSFEAVARNFNIGTTTVKDIMKRKNNIAQAVSKNRNSGIKRKVVHLGRKPEVEERLYRYLVEKTEQGEIVGNKNLLNQASVINQSLSLTNEVWIPSIGWLKKFKLRYSIDTKNLNDTLLDVPEPDEDSLQNYEDGIELMEEEEDVEETPDVQVKPSVSVLNACDILLDFMSEHDFPLKEIITVRVVKDKINMMPEGKTRCYEVVLENNLEIPPIDYDQSEYETEEDKL